MIDWARVFIVALILVTAIVVNVVINVHFNEISDTFPFIGAAVWVALLVCVPLRSPHGTSCREPCAAAYFCCRSCSRRVDDAGAQASGCVVARGARTGVCLGGVRQHSAHRAGAASRAAMTGAISRMRWASAAR